MEQEGLRKMLMTIKVKTVYGYTFLQKGEFFSLETRTFPGGEKTLVVCGTKATPFSFGVNRGDLSRIERNSVIVEE